MGVVERDSHMVVCVCNAIRESQLRDVARSSQLRCAKAASAQLGRKPKCGQCLSFARNIISDVAETACFFPDFSAFHPWPDRAVAALMPPDIPPPGHDRTTP